jgi:aspartokinase
MQGMSELVARALDALAEAGLSIFAGAQDFSENNLSFVVKQNDVQAVLVAAHREFRLGSLNPQTHPANIR